jgi:hypothetical protein
MVGGNIQMVGRRDSESVHGSSSGSSSSSSSSSGSEHSGRKEQKRERKERKHRKRSEADEEIVPATNALDLPEIEVEVPGEAPKFDSIKELIEKIQAN